MKILYFDCFSGISGDMTIGALLDAGGDFSNLQQELKKLAIDDEYELRISKVNKNGINATKFDVVIKHGETTNYNHTHKHHHDNDNQSHEHGEHDHNHSHSHGHGEHDHRHDHRSYQDIVNLIKGAELSETVKDMSLRMFKIIGEAEGKIHGMTLEEVHFHEVGAVDSIIDIVGVAILMEQLQIDKVKSSQIPTGFGHIHINHGIYPVPAPATLEVLRGVPLAQSQLKGELTTPTGASIITVLSESFCSFPSMQVEQIGYGAGTKTFPNHPNVLRVIIGKQ